MLETRPVEFTSNTHASTHTHAQKLLKTTAVLMDYAISTGSDCGIAETVGIRRKWKNRLEIKSSSYRGLQSPL